LYANFKNGSTPERKKVNTEKSEVIFEKLPGGLNRVTAGGTRNSIKLSRPWQPPLPYNPKKCPFCTKPQEEIPLPGIPNGWKLLPNIFTPHRRHRLVIPDKCPAPDFTQTLGDFEGILQALEVARLAIQNDDVEMTLFCHVGQMAGQNLGHLHWHLMEVRAIQPLNLGLLPTATLVKRIENLDINAAGARAGECVIYFRETIEPFDETTVGKIAKALHWIVCSGNEKFESTEGRSPEFCVSVRIGADKTLRYADDCPILNTWGATEYVFAPLEGGPITLPWPHETTAEYLLENYL